MYRKIISYIVVLLLLLLPGFYLKNPFGYLPCIFFLMASVFSLLYVLALRKAIVFLQPVNNMSCERNMKKQFSVVIQNKWFLACSRITFRFYRNNLFGQVSQVNDINTTLSPKEKKTFNFDIKFNHLGTYEAGISSVRIYDLLGIFYLTYKDFNKSYITVKPHCFDVDNLDFYDVAGKQISLSVSKSKMESDDYSGVRQYMLGDPIKNIHWKISAHTREYMVRTFESYASKGVSVYMDFEAKAYSNEILLSIYDCIVETAYSVANYVLGQKECVELIYNKDGSAQTLLPRNRLDMDDMILNFSGISPVHDNQLVEMFEDNATRQYGLDVIIVCTPNLNGTLVEYLIEARMLRKKVYLFYISPKSKKENFSDDEKSMLNDLTSSEVNYFVISSADELQSSEVKEYA